jgi:hypothetical protein
MININCVSNKGHRILTSINQTSFIVANYCTVKSRNISGNLRFDITIALNNFSGTLWSSFKETNDFFSFFQKNKKNTKVYSTHNWGIFHKYLFNFLQFNGNAFQVYSQECYLLLLIFIKINYKLRISYHSSPNEPKFFCVCI